MSNFLSFPIWREVLLRGYLDVRDLGVLEQGCGKEMSNWWKELIEEELPGVDIPGLYLTMNFSNAEEKLKIVERDSWFGKRKLFKLRYISIKNFDDLSCTLGIDILQNQNRIERLQFKNSFRLAPESRLTPLINGCAETLEVLQFYGVRNLSDEFLGSLANMKCLTTLTIADCPNVLFENLLQTLHKCSTLRKLYFNNINPRGDGRCEPIYYEQFKEFIECNKFLSCVSMSRYYRYLCDGKRLRMEYPKITFHKVYLMSAEPEIYHYSSNSEDDGDDDFEPASGDDQFEVESGDEDESVE